MARETQLTPPGLAALVLLGLARAVSSSTALPALTSPLGPVVNLGFAAYAGNDTSPAGQSHSTVTFFGNIPYAQPPVGNLRFRAPRPLDEMIRDPARAPIIDARDWGAPCIQQPAQVGIGSEGERELSFSLSYCIDGFRLCRLPQAEHLEAFQRIRDEQPSRHRIFPRTSYRFQHNWTPNQSAHF